MRFTTNAYPKDQRREAWRFALGRVSLELGQSDDHPYGELISFRSELGIEFIVVTATPLTIAVAMARQPDLFWLLMLLDGGARVAIEGGLLEAGAGDIVYGIGGHRAELACAQEVRFLLVKVPRALLNLRLRMPLPRRRGCSPARAARSACSRGSSAR